MMRRFMADVVRVVVLLGVVGWLLFWVDPANGVVFQALGIGLFLVGGTHLTRRLLMPRLDVQSIALDAVRQANLPAALVFCAIVWFLVQVMQISMRVFK